MQLQIELNQIRFGYLPSTILAGKIYMNAANRKLLRDMEIQNYCKPLGRPPKDPPPEEVKARWGLRLHPCRGGSELIQRTLIKNLSFG